MTALQKSDGQTGHTPGPWEAETLTSDAQPNERPWVGRLDEDRFSALACGLSQQEAVANTRLIAAAPELLKALVKLVAISDDNGPFGGELYQDRIDRAWDAARAAIAKATGASS